MEIYDLNAKIQEQGLTVTALEDELKKLKGKDLADNVICKHTIDPEMLKIDVKYLNPRLLNNRSVHSDYLKHTQEEAAILREIVEHGKSLNPLNESLDSALKPSTSASGSRPSGNTKKDKIQRTPKKFKEEKFGNNRKSVIKYWTYTGDLLIGSRRKQSVYSFSWRYDGVLSYMSLVKRPSKTQVLAMAPTSVSTELWSKDEAPDFIIKFLKMIQVRLKVPVRRIETDNGTEFVNQTLRGYYEKVGISHETSVARSP
ncbi:retrovirus-related pol polyprotein from transposon TNT 1-94 [Tanacetum coccineum]